MTASAFQKKSGTARVGASILAAILAVTCGTAFAEGFEFTPVKPEIVSARTAGMAGAYSAMEAGFDTLSTNPAALAYVSGEWSFSRVTLNASGPLFDLGSVVQASDKAASILKFVSANNGIYLGANAAGPIAFGRVDKNFGFGVFNRTIVNANIPALTKATVYAGEELQLVGAYGITVFSAGKNSVSAGLQMKGFFQTFGYESGTALSVLSNFTKLSTSTLPVVLSTGFGLDAGLLYKYDDRFSAGLTCKDAFTPVFSTHYANFAGYQANKSDHDTSYNRLDPDLTIGVLYQVPFPESWTVVSSLRFMTDYRDSLFFLKKVYRNPILNFAAGTELVLLDVVSLRTGISESYLATGLGLDLTFCKLDFAMYGSELGLEPGKRPLLNMTLGVSFEY
jgi:hypothetical protein